MRKFIIRNGTLCDGTGSELKKCDILIENDIIADIAVDIADEDAEVIDVAGKIVAPGFIDAHSHSEIFKLKYPENRTKLMQGVTTEVDGNCGMHAGCVPYRDETFKWDNIVQYVEILNFARPSVNTVILAGHNDLRHAAAPNAEKITLDMLKKMQYLLQDALAGGAAGFSSGLTYFPGKFADSGELKVLNSVLKGSEKIYASHIRSEGDDILSAVDEALEIASCGSGRFQFSHMKTMFKRNWHKLDTLLEKIDAAKKAGVDVTADRYPYIHSATNLHQILPEPYFNMENISDFLRTSEKNQQLVTEALKNSPRDLATTVVVSCGRTLERIASERACSIERTAMECLMENNRQRAVYQAMSEENLTEILSLPYVCAGSDGLSVQLDDPENFVHPRAAGTFPRFFRMVSERCGIAEAVRRMTSLPARIFRIPRRGVLQKGYFADIVIFDSQQYDSKAGFDGTSQFPTGVEKVFVNGVKAFDCNSSVIDRHGRYIAIN